jgi:tripartite-type tricarboxylate transporter receptor subunit TctC
MVGPRGMTTPQTAYWEEVFARIADSDEWKSMLEHDTVTGEFLRSTATRAQLKSDYDELKEIMADLGLIKP